ncbi:hypothetical protein VB712_16270 [Spirulina sp. CCNP1310]|uniref:hypothetical protein n=1 Tax=Spirulina sp. CCNP1310 TaxID=3110249 RepID=UPI002B1FA194|nr:hypothetical protein [Spirulina sp. CCNP1310]MEA5420789.1 hypothetical protein [Spirulina sp. CCNP1310]
MGKIFKGKRIRGGRSPHLHGWGIVIGLAILGGGLTGGITPLPLAAQTMQPDIQLQRRPDDTYDTFLRRAEAAARAGVQRQFDSNPLVTTADIMVYGKNSGVIVPLLRLRVTRRNWINLPDPQQWATYFPMARQFLGFEPEGSGTPESPAPAPPPAPAEPPPAPSAG